MTRIQGAVVGTRLDGGTAVTGSDGCFTLITETAATFGDSVPYNLWIEVSGLPGFEKTHTWGDHPKNQKFVYREGDSSDPWKFYGEQGPQP